MSDSDLIEFVQSAEGRSGWGLHRHLDIDGHPVFVKAIPLTAEERAAAGSTANVFGLPAHYHYGVGSAGFGAMRELQAHQTTTAWVLDGESEHFPLLYHHRVVPLAGQTRSIGPELEERLRMTWGADESIDRFIDARSASTHAIVLLVEHIPFVVRDWIPDHPDFTDAVIDQARSVTDFMRARGVAHLDAHLDNVLTDGETIFFADFGLLLDSDFELDAAERSFLQTHRYFDIAEFVASLSWPDRNGHSDHGPLHAAALEPFRDLIEAFSGVFFDLATGGAAASRYDDELIAELLDQAFAIRSDKSLSS